MSNDTAFPNDYTFPENRGLTKREYFAAVALQAVIAKNPVCGELHEDPGDCAKPRLYSECAVRYADALLAELEKQP